MLSSYKCPNCNADIPFDAKSGKLKCSHCDSSFDIEDLEAYNVEQKVETDVCDWNIKEAEVVEVNGKISYICPSCNGEVVGDDNMAATSCPYCGTAIVLGEKLSGILKPDLIIPFTKTKEDAKKAYADFIKGKKLLPDDFKLNNIINKLNGMYVPYWLFDANANGTARFRASISRTHIEGDYRVTETSYYLAIRDGSAEFEKVPVDGSLKIEDGLLDSIEPFDYSEAKDFNGAYLANFLADKYDQDKDQTISKANKRIKNTISSLLASSVVGYDSVMPESCYINVNNGKASYALMPVYLFSTKYKGKVYQFAMNGQTGKFTGDLPMDKSKALRVCLITFVIAFIVSFVVLFIFNGGLTRWKKSLHYYW